MDVPVLQVEFEPIRGYGTADEAIEAGRRAPVVELGHLRGPVVRVGYGDDALVLQTAGGDVLVLRGGERRVVIEMPAAGMTAVHENGAPVIQVVTPQGGWLWKREEDARLVVGETLRRIMFGGDADAYLYFGNKILMLSCAKETGSGRSVLVWGETD
jgi:hypothetical protein